ncbi:MAG: hypothetical protein DRO94_04015 [Candidatus Altiarchaeales archaeon]|nr:MAG: hypothetical protein DRO95_00800 [Candidatus Altiarchaeales archaeon]RLI93954.1 MAG: hypothetical protein DRO94_04015 [Candidatus Altiarchaeales archaeon]HDO82485.1 hypothetical protein [Candidatus Altiarchaeales archaeon]HEX55134.1 hypothetical protein [Candidatus Altiarchaeales archaeon]
MIADIKKNCVRNVPSFILIIFILLFLSNTTFSRTSISTEDCDITVTVNIAFYGDGANQSLIDKWEQEAENLWNGPHGYRIFGYCKCRVHFDFNMKIVSNKDSCPDDYHCIEVKNVPTDNDHRSFVKTGAMPGKGFDKGPYTKRATGEFSNRDDGKVVAHEIGHLMGLDDEYFDFSVDFTINNDGSITINNLIITYPPGMPITDDIRKKVREGIGNLLSRGRVSKGHSYTWNSSSLIPGAMNDSIMGMEPGFNWTATQGHIDQICEETDTECPNKCCCGNGKFDAGREECDPKAIPTGCKDNLYCTSLCKCLPYVIPGHETTTTSTTTTISQKETTTIPKKTTTTLETVVTPRCGDGYLSSPREECDMADHPIYSNWSGAKVYLCPKGKVCVNCKCVQLTPTCGDGWIYRPPNYGLPGVWGEECDPKATPTGCEEGKICTQDCRCESEEKCPDGFYTSEDCEGKCGENEACEFDLETGCYSCVKIACKENSDCGEIIKKRVCYNNDVYEQTIIPICYNPGTPEAECKFRISGISRGGQLLPPLEDCDPGYCLDGQCVGKITTTMEETTTITETTTTTIMTCEDMGMYSSESACDNECDPPDRCVYHEGYECWYCQQVECGEGLYESSNCDGECDPTRGEVCEEYQDTGCYRCVCPDLMVTSISAKVSLSANTHCQDEICKTDCSLSATVEFQIRNIGARAVDASTAQVKLAPAVGTETEAVESLDPGEVSTTKTLYFSRFATVTGSGMVACEQLDWWSSEYTATVIADFENDVAECDEDNNENSVYPSPT